MNDEKIKVCVNCYLMTYTKTQTGSSCTKKIYFHTLKERTEMRIQIATRNSTRNTGTSLEQPWLPYILARVDRKFHNTFGCALLSQQDEREDSYSQISHNKFVLMDPVS
jgi:hypothetical protein